MADQRKGNGKVNIGIEAKMRINEVKACDGRRQKEIQNLFCKLLPRK